jgi:23S rRNA pseudouridine955/2504/2580 synthase
MNITIKNHPSPIRLDRYLRTINPLLTQGLLEQYLRKKLIIVNDAKASTSLRISNGDQITISPIIADKIQPHIQCIKTSPSIEALANKLLGEYLIYDHPSFLAINKPSGLATQGGSKISLSIDDALSFLRQENMDLKLVHRLDKDTSGILLIAKGRDVSEKFMHAFKKHKVQKRYMAILSGTPQKATGQIKSYLVKEKDFEVSSYYEEMPGRKEAITDYEVIEVFNMHGTRLYIDPKFFRTKPLEPISDTLHNWIPDVFASKNSGIIYTLVQFKPLTGRMHQLRVHAKLMGCPIVGDVRYNGESASHLMLHASDMVIDKCIFDKEIVIKADLPEHFMI